MEHAGESPDGGEAVSFNERAGILQRYSGIDLAEVRALMTLTDKTARVTMLIRIHTDSIRIASRVKLKSISN
jgi:hypothetical protein